MKKIGFIGMYDKTDLMIYVAKILTAFRKKILVVDATTHQKAKYIVPTMSPSVTYITDFEDIDVAVGFPSLESIKNYLGVAEEQEIEYDFVLIDVNNKEAFENFRLENAQRNYFVTSFDTYSLKKGLEILSEIQNPIHVTKVLFSKEMLKEEDDYLNFLSLGNKIIWNEYRIYFPLESGDLNVIYENQRVSKIRLKKLTVPYKDGLVYLSEEILGDIGESNIRKTIKLIEKGV